MARLLDANGVRELRAENNYSRIDRLYEGDQNSNKSGAQMAHMEGRSIIASVEKGGYENSKLYADVWNRLSDYRTKLVKNAAMLPDDWATMTDLIRVDISRRR